MTYILATATIGLYNTVAKALNLGSTPQPQVSKRAYTMLSVRAHATRRLSIPLLLLSLLATGAAAQTPTGAFANPAFATRWERTDAPVASGSTKRTWFWGPQPNTGSLSEEYREGIGGKRVVQYFDKSRMEINDPGADPASAFYVTNGLLTVELISGRMQTGNNSFVTRAASRTNVTGDAGDTLSPAYADLANVSNAVQERRDPNRTGQPATATLSKDGKVGSDPARATVPGVTVAYYEKTTGHNIPQAMWEFLNSSGQVSVGGKLSEARLSEPWFYASGLPISDPYWVRATIGGKATDVLVQAYERRMLTYVPTNPGGIQGRDGQHRPALLRVALFERRHPSAGTNPGGDRDARPCAGQQALPLRRGPGRRHRPCHSRPG